MVVVVERGLLYIHLPIHLNYDAIGLLTIKGMVMVGGQLHIHLHIHLNYNAL